ncbi:hypothetical protein OHA77_09670 [Streptosporangium sp. NBC_01639]|uniref:hypothetical protein n=1 Tax=unclassified Streptosporangium TaxID=2632669 RepID=UPI002DDC6873|nr:hypothetical protein [Streptosporangium sp. NBC_01756]WSC84584.1 hypothetical protein OIE48_29985 [Streptosporangium sp. NBC_01756]WTD56778.1 hypothetical protein OHA77_09670 [Streptosporangium sp. NBC_01639]
MKLFNRMPAEVRTAVAPTDRVLTYAGGPDGYVIATDRALYLGGTRLPWFQVDRGVWDEQGLTVVTTAGESYRALLPEPGRIPEAVRERVTASILVNQYAPLDARGGVLLVARKTDDDRVVWEFVFDAGLDPADPGLRALAEQALEETRRSFGV